MKDGMHVWLCHFKLRQSLFRRCLLPDQLYQALYDRVYSKLFQHIGSFEQALPLPIAVPAWGLLEIGVLPGSRFVKFWIHLVEGCRRYNVYTILEIMKY